LLDDYLAAIGGIRKHLLRYTHPNNFAFVGSLQGTTFISDMVTTTTILWTSLGSTCVSWNFQL